MQNTFYIQKLDEKRRIDDFYSLPYKIYASDKNWIPPLIKDIKKIFSPKENPFFKQGELERWNLYNEKGEVCGRIAAFTNKAYKNKGDKQATGGIGFFECIDNQSAANLLFDTAKQWLAQRSMQAMDGPINFGERNNWWGLLTEGFYPPMYGMNYHASYYQKLFEKYGFQPFFMQYCFVLPLGERFSNEDQSYYEKWAADPDMRIERLRKNELSKYARNFVSVYNEAWATHEGEKKMDYAQVVSLFKKMKFVMDPRLMCFVYHKDKPIAMMIAIPDLNEYFKYLKGKWNILRFLFLRIFVRPKRIVGLAFGIVPEWRGKGIDRYMMIGFQKKQKIKNQIFEMQWIGDFNPKMLALAARIGAKKSRTFITYRYLFNRDQPFERHPILK